MSGLEDLKEYCGDAVATAARGALARARGGFCSTARLHMRAFWVPIMQCCAHNLDILERRFDNTEPSWLTRPANKEPWPLAPAASCCKRQSVRVHFCVPSLAALTNTFNIYLKMFSCDSAGFLLLWTAGILWRVPLSKAPCRHGYSALCRAC